MATEKRLIDANALIHRLVAERDNVKIKTGPDIGYHNGLNMGISMTINADTVDAVEVVHGHWFSLTDCSNAGVYCSVCNKKVWKEDYAWCNRKNKLRSNYCPNCGAKMDGDGNG